MVVPPMEILAAVIAAVPVATNMRVYQIDKTRAVNLDLVSFFCTDELATKPPYSVYADEVNGQRRIIASFKDRGTAELFLSKIIKTK